MYICVTDYLWRNKGIPRPVFFPSVSRETSSLLCQTQRKDKLNIPKSWFTHARTHAHIHRSAGVKDSLLVGRYALLMGKYLWTVQRLTTPSSSVKHCALTEGLSLHTLRGNKPKPRKREFRRNNVPSFDVSLTCRAVE